jgi:hypothetical protein
VKLNVLQETLALTRSSVIKSMAEDYLTGGGSIDRLKTDRQIIAQLDGMYRVKSNDFSTINIRSVAEAMILYINTLYE